VVEFLVFEKLRCAFRVYYLMRFRYGLFLSSSLNFQLMALGKSVNIVYVCVYECMYAYIYVYSVNKMC